MEESIRDAWSCLQCGQCRYFNVRAADKNFESKCKRLDHKHIKFAKPWFKSYDCNQFNSTVCCEFEPAEWCKWLYEHWQGWDDYWQDDISWKKGTISLVLDDNFDIRYKVSAYDFVEGTFLDDDGNLKWIEKEYYKKVAKSPENPIGYRLIHEQREF